MILSRCKKAVFFHVTAMSGETLRHGLSAKIQRRALEAKAEHGTWRAAAAALGINHSVLYQVARGNTAHVSRERELELARALGILPPPRRVRRVSVAAIPRQAIRVCAELAEKFPGVYSDEAAAVLRWLGRIEQ